MPLSAQFAQTSLTTLLLISSTLIPTTSFAQIQLPNRPSKVEAADIKTNIATDGRLHLKIQYLNNFHLNDKVPEAKRISLTLTSSNKTYSTPQFIQTNGGADLFFNTETPAATPPIKGSLRIYLCRADQCQIVRKEVSWSPSAAPTRSTP